jgi:hypothetical protein
MNGSRNDLVGDVGDVWIPMLRNKELAHGFSRPIAPDCDFAVSFVNPRRSLQGAFRFSRALPSTNNEVASALPSKARVHPSGAPFLTYGVLENLVTQMPEPSFPSLDAYRRDSGLSIDEFWLRCFELGCMNSSLEIEAFVEGALQPTLHEYNMMAVALNERFTDLGVSHVVPYIDRWDNKP